MPPQAYVADLSKAPYGESPLRGRPYKGKAPYGPYRRFLTRKAPYREGPLREGPLQGSGRLLGEAPSGRIGPKVPGGYICRVELLILSVPQTLTRVKFYPNIGVNLALGQSGRFQVTEPPFAPSGVERREEGTWPWTSGTPCALRLKTVSGRVGRTYALPANSATATAGGTFTWRSVILPCLSCAPCSVFLSLSGEPRTTGKHPAL